MNQRKSNKRKRDDDHNSNEEIETENNIQRKKKKKVEIDEKSMKKLNDKEKYEIIMKNYEKEGYDSSILMKALYFYWVGGYKKFLSLYNENNSFKRMKKNEKESLLSYEKYCSDVLEEIKLIQLLDKNKKKERGKNNIEKIHTLIDNLFLKVQNNEIIGEYFYLYRGKCYGKIGNVEKTLSIAIEGIELTKNKSLLKKMHLNVGNRLYTINDFVGAVEWYNKAIESDPNYARAYCNKGSSLKQIKDFIGAIECYNKAIELDPNYAGAYYKKGDTLRKIKDFIGAMVCLNKAIEIDSNKSSYHLNKGRCFFHMYKINDAISCVNKSISLSPTNVEYYQFLARLYRINSNFEESIYCYTKAINLSGYGFFYYRRRNDVYSQLKEKVIGFDNELFNSFDNFSFEG